MSTNRIKFVLPTVKLGVMSCLLFVQAGKQSLMARPSCMTKSDSKRQLEIQRKLLSQELDRLEYADPVEDLRKALKKKHFRFIGYKAFTVEVPGVALGQRDSYVLKYGVEIIKGTSDVITQTERQRLQKVVRKYVVPYNKLLIRHLQAISEDK